MTEGSKDPGMKRLHFLKPSGRKLSLWRRSLVDPNAHEDLSQKGKDA